MRAPLLSFVLVLAVVATMSPVPAVSKVEEAGAAAAEENGGSIKPLSWSLDAYGPQEKAAKKPKEQILDVQGTPKMTADTYNQEPIEKQAEVAKTSTADDQPKKYVASLDPENEKDKKAAAEVKKEKSNESAEESVYPKKEKKVKKEKKEKSDYLDESTSSKKEKKEKSDESADESAYTKKEKKVKKEKKEKSDDSDEYASLTKKVKKEKKEKSDDSDEDASLTNKKEKKKHKKVKSDDDDSDSTSPKKAKKEKSIDLDASSAYLKQEEKKSSDSDDEATSLEKQKKEKKKKLKKEKSSEEENAEVDAAPVDVSPGGKYVPSEKPDVSTSTDEYVSSSTKADGKPKKGERQISTNAEELIPAMAADSPDEIPPVAKSSATADAYPSPNQQQELVVSSSQSQPMAAGSPDELPPSAKPKKSATFDPYASSKHQVFSSQQPMANDSPDELPPQAKTYDETAAEAGGGKPKLSMEMFSGMIKTPIANLLSPVIKGVCAKAEFPADCESSIAGLPGAASAAATDSVGVLKLAMEAVREKVIVAMNAATDRMHAPGVDPTTKDALDACTSSYSDMKSSLDYVDDALKRGDVDTAKTNLDAVETDLTTCDEGFKEHGTPPLMSDHDQELQKLAGNLVYIGSTIKHE